MAAAMIGHSCKEGYLMYDHLGVQHHLHMTTKNTSFLKFSQMLKTLGVLNYHFPLTLVDGTLAGLNPFDPSLTFSDTQKVIKECLVNPWYFFRECVKVPTRDTLAPFHLTRQSAAKIWCHLQGIDTTTIAMRQSGVSITESACMLYDAIVGITSSRIHDWSRASSALSARTVKSLRHALPPFLRDLTPPNDAVAGYSFSIGDVSRNWSGQSNYTRDMAESSFRTSPSLTIFDLPYHPDESPKFLIDVFKEFRGTYESAGYDRKHMPLSVNMNGMKVDTRYKLWIYHTFIENAPRFTESDFYDVNPEDQDVSRCLIHFDYKDLGYSTDYLADMTTLMNLSEETLTSDWVCTIDISEIDAL